ncbi:helix-turn-helix domain-containing protein [Tychonema sp. BBK16]|uniref:helix-turn-helix domain-containing protein n=1 Tax=Tychonema sp. BBK16 TaxID=2699888 RepID=UPI0038D2CCED
MKARYRYRFYPTSQQQQSLARLFGCVRVVWNDALAICKQSEKKPNSADLQKIVITQAKNTEERVWLNIVQVGMGNRHDSKRAQRDCKTTSVARPDEASRITAHKRSVSISSYLRLGYVKLGYVKFRSDKLGGNRQ